MVEEDEFEEFETEGERARRPCKVQGPRPHRPRHAGGPLPVRSLWLAASPSGRGVFAAIYAFAAI